MKVALYARVSTEEQAKHGLSIDTQLDNLRAWAVEQGHTVVDEYVDAGVSARKNPAKRPELQRLLGDLDKIEAIAFTKLDRWTRNIRGYFQVQEQLDAHRVAWIATQEDYETVTAAGRFKVNIMLSVAENEADRTSERIRDVFDRKIAKGEYTGHRIPLGYSIIDGKLIPNEDADIVRAAFAEFRRSENVSAVMELLHRHGHTVRYTSARRLLQRERYAGRYRDNEAYCAPIIPPAEFDEVQRLLQRRSVRSNPSKRVYLFSGLLRCPVCGGSMGACWSNNSRAQYRCLRHFNDRLCPNHRQVREADLEEYLLTHLDELVAAVSSSTAPERKQVDRTVVSRKLDRLKDLYVDGLIDKATYMRDRERLIAQAPSEPRRRPGNLLRVEDLRSRYASLSPEDRRSLWRSIIDHIVADGDSYDVYFLD